MNNNLNYTPTYQIGKVNKKTLKQDNLKFSTFYNKDKISKQYINHIEELINFGKMDKAQELVVRYDRFPDNYSVYLRRYSLEDFKKFFPNLDKTKLKNKIDDLMIK